MYVFLVQPDALSYSAVSGGLERLDEIDHSC